MAPTPTTIPTSFVPKQPVRTTQKFSSSGGNILLTISTVLLVASLIAAGAAFGYKEYLTGVLSSKSTALEAAQSMVDKDAVSEFVRTRDRLQLAKELLDSHIAASRFFKLLESETLANVRFGSLSFDVADDGSAEITLQGTARTFNALAAQSSRLAEEKLIKRAIFSEISVNQDTDLVNFSLTADLDPRLLAFSQDEAPAVSAPESDAMTSEGTVPEETGTPAPASEVPAEGTAPSGPAVGPQVTP